MTKDARALPGDNRSLAIHNSEFTIQRSLRLDPGQLDKEPRALSRRRLHLDAPAMRLDNLIDNRQSEPSPVRETRLERLKQLLDLDLRKAYATVR